MILLLKILQISARSVRRDAVLQTSESEMAIYGILISSGFDIQKYLHCEYIFYVTELRVLVVIMSGRRFHSPSSGSRDSRRADGWVIPYKDLLDVQ
jgi:hypothetical protein